MAIRRYTQLDEDDENFDSAFIDGEETEYGFVRRFKHKDIKTDTILDDIDEERRQKKENIEKEIQEKKEKIKDGLKTAKDKTKDGLKSAKGKTEDILDKAMLKANDIKNNEKFNGLGDKVKNNVHGFNDKFKDGSGKLGDKIKTGVNGVGSNIKNNKKNILIISVVVFSLVIVLLTFNIVRTFIGNKQTDDDTHVVFSIDSAVDDSQDYDTDDSDIDNNTNHSVDNSVDSVDDDIGYIDDDAYYKEQDDVEQDLTDDDVTSYSNENEILKNEEDNVSVVSQDDIIKQPLVSTKDVFMMYSTYENLYEWVEDIFSSPDMSYISGDEVVGGSYGNNAYFYILNSFEESIFQHGNFAPVGRLSEYDSVDDFLSSITYQGCSALEIYNIFKDIESYIQDRSNIDTYGYDKVKLLYSDILRFNGEEYKDEFPKYQVGSE